MPASLHRAAFCTILCAAGIAQQQFWVPVDQPATLGVAVAGSPLPPRFVQAARSLSAISTPVWELDGTVFHRRAEPAPAALNWAEAAVYDVAHARVVVWCSTFQGAAPPGGSASVCTFDGARWQVQATGLPPARLQPGLAYDAARSAVVLFGGLLPGFPIGAPLGDTWELRGSQWTQVPPAFPPPPRYACAMAFDPPSQRVVMFGGGDGLQTLADTWSFDGVAWTRSAAVGPSARRGAVFGFDPQRQVLVLYGGIDNIAAFGALLGDAYEWNGSGWLSVGAPLPALSSPALVQQGLDLLLAGHDEVTQRLLLWRRVGTGWVSVLAHAQVPGVTDPALAFDLANFELVRFGGRSPTAGLWLDETFTWNGRWQQRTLATAPPPRSRAAMAFDFGSAKCVLFGGEAMGSFLGDTWVWDGAQWTPQHPPVSPAARSLHAMAADPSRGTVVLHGGSSSIVFNDTWEWNGTTWTQLTTPAPPPAFVRGDLAFDAARQVLALYQNGGGLHPSTLWELQGSTWVQVLASAPASARLVYDPARGVLALFGQQHRFDLVNGAFVADPQPSFGSVYVGDLPRQQLLACDVGSLDQPVAYSVSVPALAIHVGSGCGPLGETTLSVDRAPQLGAGMHWQVRTLAPAAVLLGLSLQSANVPLGNGCTVRIGGSVTGLLGFAAASGWADIATPLPVVPQLVGLQLQAQAVAVLPASALTLSNGVQLQLGQ